VSRVRSHLPVMTAALSISLVGCVGTSPIGPVIRGAAPASETITVSSFAEAAEPKAPSLPPPAPASASPDLNRPLTLDDLEQLAQTHNPILARDRARIESARGQAVQAGLYPNPRFDTNNPEVFAGSNSTYNVGFTQEIVVKGKLGLDTAAAAEAVRQAELTFAQNRLDLITNVRRQYYAILGDRRAVESLTDLARIVRQAAETGKKLERAQETSKIDTLLLQVDAAQVAANLRQAELNYSADRKQLAAIVGTPGLDRAEIAGDLTSRRPNFDEELLRRYAVTGSTLIQVAQAEIARRRLLLQRAEVEPYPNLTVGPAYQFGPADNSRQFWLTIQFPIPVWDRNQGNILAAAANVRDAESTLGVVQNDQLNRVAETLGKYLAARVLVERYEADILPDVRRAQALSAEGYAKGVFDFARYLQAQRTAVETNRGYTDALNALWSAAVDLAGILQLEHMP
jgi:outer membrane protein, heavy metal efflux system